MSQSFAVRVRALGIPLDQIVVIGSGLLDQLGLRRASDIDIVASRQLYKTFFQGVSGWRKEVFDNQVIFTHEKAAAELWADWVTRNGRASYDELIKDSVVIDGVRFVSLDFLRKWKQWRNRPKDRRDLELIEGYLEEQL